MRREFFILANVNETQRSSAVLSGMSGCQKGKGVAVRKKSHKFFPPFKFKKSLF